MQINFGNVLGVMLLNYNSSIVGILHLLRWNKSTYIIVIIAVVYFMFSIMNCFKYLIYHLILIPWSILDFSRYYQHLPMRKLRSRMLSIFPRITQGRGRRRIWTEVCLTGISMFFAQYKLCWLTITLTVTEKCVCWGGRILNDVVEDNLS